MKPLGELRGVVSMEASAGLAWSVVRLRRDGQRPLCFSGCLVAGYDGWAPRAMVWHDLALYRTGSAGYAIEIVARLAVAPDMALPRGGQSQPRPQSRPSRSHAVLFDTLDDALTRFESHDASGDICPGLSAPACEIDDPMTPPAMLAVRATILQGYCLDVVNRYAVGVGSFLNHLCLAGV